MCSRSAPRADADLPVDKRQTWLWKATRTPCYARYRCSDNAILGWYSALETNDPVLEIVFQNGIIVLT